MSSETATCRSGGVRAVGLRDISVLYTAVVLSLERLERRCSRLAPVVIVNRLEAYMMGGIRTPFTGRGLAIARETVVGGVPGQSTRQEITKGGGRTISEEGEEGDDKNALHFEGVEMR